MIKVALDPEPTLENLEETQCRHMESMRVTQAQDRTVDSAAPLCWPGSQL